MSSRIPPCLNCAHFDMETFTCPAYSHCIPDDMFACESMHYDVRTDQQGEYVYTPVQDPWDYQQRFFPETIRQETAGAGKSA